MILPMTFMFLSWMVTPPQIDTQEVTASYSVHSVYDAPVALSDGVETLSTAPAPALPRQGIIIIFPEYWNPLGEYFFRYPFPD